MKTITKILLGTAAAASVATAGIAYAAPGEARLDMTRAQAQERAVKMFERMDANKDGTVTVRFGGDPKAPNYLRIMPGWNYIVRLYKPGEPILDGSFSFPKAVPAK